MYRPSVQAVPGAKVLRHRPVAPKGSHAVRSVASRPRSSLRPNAVSGRGGPCRRLPSSPRRTAAASGWWAVPTTKRDG
ncbi:hypothetical protein [Amycolatopsis keratiniphila]|uniref:Uncharacterized protein n=1 Tax=Amycolatopsis keratiniphila subsp. keratiniphila TaxID=227715 RepID=A0A1W2LJ88_9PSEU|nr:hypothetical protein [Amycolatopsis keratiniphila]ONF62900.1 hypothetical protein AVR91_0236245 [Amycolatopsis keratiniphila subsp. keratiniphila]